MMITIRSKEGRLVDYLLLAFLGLLAVALNIQDYKRKKESAGSKNKENGENVSADLF